MNDQHASQLIKAINSLVNNQVETNRLLSEFLKYTLRHEGDSRKESA